MGTSFQAKRLFLLKSSSLTAIWTDLRKVLGAIHTPPLNARTTACERCDARRYPNYRYTPYEGAVRGISKCCQTVLLHGCHSFHGNHEQIRLSQITGASAFLKLLNSCPLLLLRPRRNDPFRIVTRFRRQDPYGPMQEPDLRKRFRSPGSHRCRLFAEFVLATTS